jgi:hypothetical protein
MGHVLVIYLLFLATGPGRCKRYDKFKLKNNRAIKWPNCFGRKAYRELSSTYKMIIGPIYVPLFCQSIRNNITILLTFQLKK